ncbi:N-acyl homoserine lactonase family protein [Kineococcus rhizosphaerae]|uniref:Glyoxylase-like metal-dependent hydrolase (Beta-lactamase superfamily II) n=1 Tax=Kineococcus rhizosphaerae TaxID=559628 RepID=A0A2T0R3I8_9ACTN|nr:N-acyl homoserine lactonase family protein [Kineococcus rhizosphaerae]PRY14627.1 glyoxylase-like metal-dependent hydrolase (beta-lactamase superfamily II) [Kineococcus rhizosphaerae]
MTLAGLRPAVPGRWTVSLVHYADRDGVRGQHFGDHDEHAGEPHPTAYFAWLLVGTDEVVLVDTGIGPERAAGVAGLRYRGSPVALLGDVGLSAGDVDRCVLTHLHYDHAGCVRDLPRAGFVVQRAELDYWTGPIARRIRREHWLHEAADTAHVVAATAAGRGAVLDGDAELADGLSVHLVGGHTAGTQVVRVVTAAGPVVVASDASHFYENLETDRPGPLRHTTGLVHTAYDRVRELGEGGPGFLPGHDPEVLERFPALPGSAGAVVRVA